MPYKNKEEQNKKALEYYYKNRKKVLEYQKARWQNKYQEDSEFRQKRQLRDKSRIVYGRSLKNKKCSKCESTNDLQRHHPNYESIEFEILCRNCHNQLHNSLKGKDQSSVTT